MGKRLRKFLLLVNSAVFVAALCVLVGLYLAARRSLPVVNGEVRLAGIAQGATVSRDSWGIPHIKAETEADAYFALGYSKAQDRLFQIELLRRLAEGELAEIAGPVAVDIDRMMRTLRLRPKAVENAALLQERYPEVFASAEAFLAGVNEFATHGAKPFEFTVLGIPRRTYTMVDSLCIAGILPITFSYGPRQDAMFSIVRERFPDLDPNLLFPGYSQGIPTTVMETKEEAEAILRERGLWPPKSISTPVAQSAALQTFVAQWQRVSDFLGNHLGSNAWLLAPSRTASGGAILANDPHIGYMNPSIWYEAQVTYDGFDLYGYYLPLIPIALIGHNRDLGWGLTMFANDDVDLYCETIDPADVNRVMYKGEWTDIVTERETIKVRFGDDVEHVVQVTPHGPIVTPFLERFEDYEGPPVSLYWVWQHVDYTDIAAFYGMARARDYDMFAEAVSLVTSPGVNVLYADGSGNIAWWAAGKLPIRPAHVNNKALLDGAKGTDEPLGFLPFEQNPHLKNPAWGYIASANNKSSVRAFGPIDDLEGYWQPWDRAERIEALIESKAQWTADDVMAMQNDGVGIAAGEIIRAVRDAAGDAITSKEQELLARLEAWDGSHTVDAIEPTVYTYLCDAILKHAAGDELGENNLGIYATLGDAWCFLRYVVQQDDSPLWDDRTTPDRVESRKDIFIAAFHDAVGRLEAEYGADSTAWTWGRDHTVTFTHVIGYVPGLGRLFNVGPFPAPGGGQTINNLLHPHGIFNHKVIAGPSTRRVIDFADVEHSHAIIPTGNSGHFMSPHYGDQADLFMAGEYREVVFTEEQIAANAEHVLRMLPD